MTIIELKSTYFILSMLVHVFINSIAAQRGIWISFLKMNEDWWWDTSMYFKSSWSVDCTFGDFIRLLGE